MKIKGKLIIPLVAILIAMFTLGATPGVAVDTSASSEVTTTEYDPLTYVPPTAPATSSLEEEVEVMISDMFGDDLQQAEGPLRSFSEMMAGLLSSIKRIINSLINMLQIGGGMLGDGGALGGNLLGGIL